MIKQTNFYVDCISYIVLTWKCNNNFGSLNNYTSVKCHKLYCEWIHHKLLTL